MTFPLMFLAAITCIAGFIPFGNLISSNGEAYTIHLDMQILIEFNQPLTLRNTLVYKYCIEVFHI